MAPRHERRVGYGRHAEGRPGAIPVAVLLEAAIREGRPIHLAWPSTAPTAARDELPTAELPTISDVAGPPTSDRNS